MTDGTSPEPGGRREAVLRYRAAGWAVLRAVASIAVLATVYYLLPFDRSSTPVSELMSPEVYSVTRETGVAVAANIMRERRIHRLLVTDRGRLVGIVTSLDLLRIVEERG